MDYVPLGRTGLRVSAAGLGCGGHSRLGQGSGESRAHSVGIVRAALDLGINFIDTAAVYRTEEIVGDALAGRRDDAIISTKLPIVPPGESPLGQQFVTGESLASSLEESLRRLKTDYVDILHLHGVMPDQYGYCREELLPALDRFRDQGKIRFLGLTERFIHDPQHVMLSRALQDDIWNVVMAGFNLINPSARQRVFAQTRSKEIGTLVMFAVRRALSNSEALTELIADLVQQDLIPSDALEEEDPLGFLRSLGGAGSVVEGAYRFCRHEPGADVVLTGTGNADHLRENVASILSPALAPDCLAQLEELFGAIDSVSGN
ncbi:aldo/keto reductase [Denitrobaculum tricleocarpae]|uniref:Aldo/keto reductase n=1 Tax=Denitrobaculum tricleocarpae TaxID=2591009 RepID=A0A545STB2_9PROT|nr:aldo/keto reductase [Denitrobaculum tricleocarpae]TQV68213.1 aldo/keto reductase [Denitrobaculum tricleocarpae]